MSLTVVDPGWASRVVGAPRQRSRRLGVPVGGAADRAAWQLGNALVGNDPHATALEVCLKGPIVRAQVELGCVVAGAPFELASTRQSLKANRTFTLAAGEELHVGGTSSGMCAYLCVRGGLQAAEVLGSSSGLETIRRGDELACTSGRIRPRFFAEVNVEKNSTTDVTDNTDRRREPLYCLPSVSSVKSVVQACVRVVPGPQADWFDGMDGLLGQNFTVSPSSNRMGLRLEGEPLTVLARELVSEPVAPGAVQVTRDGQCIILGVDGQTIGGYPKIAHVIAADLDLLGQLRPGEALRFAQVDLEEAKALWGQRERALGEWALRARVSLAG
jgi:biotin-dependent carboxylase-like uncharacterized protein